MHIYICVKKKRQKRETPAHEPGFSLWGARVNASITIAHQQLGALSSGVLWVDLEGADIVTVNAASVVQRPPV